VRAIEIDASVLATTMAAPDIKTVTPATTARVIFARHVVFFSYAMRFTSRTNGIVTRICGWYSRCFSSP
jgi:hypothetical protein